VVVTHDSIVASIADNALFLTGGRVIDATAQRRVLLDRMKSFGGSPC
jgi:ABC-type lipoprotein export system ATPase subunit